MLARFQAYARDVLTAAVEVRAVSAFVVAAGLTLAVTTPMWLSAEDARDDRRREEAQTVQVEAVGIFVDTAATDPAPLDGRVVSGDVVVSVQSPGLAAVAYQVRDVERALVFENADEQGPGFVVQVPSTSSPTLDTSSLADGLYDLLVTLTYEDGSIERRAAVFIVENTS